MLIYSNMSRASTLRVIPNILICAFVFCFFLFFPNFAYAFSGSGSGIEGNPYFITTCSQLREIDDDADAYYELGGNSPVKSSRNYF